MNDIVQSKCQDVVLGDYCMSYNRSVLCVAFPLTCHYILHSLFVLFLSQGSAVADLLLPLFVGSASLSQGSHSSDCHDAVDGLW